jgi:hypothetical protein
MIVIYRIDFAGRDFELAETCQIEGARYLCFTDRESLPEPWEAVPAQRLFSCPRITGLWHKTHPHEILPPHDYSILINGNTSLLKDPTSLIRPGIGMHRHRWRRCLFEEAKFCRNTGVMAPEECSRQLSAYKPHAIVRPTGLWESGAIIFDNTPITRKFNEEWWRHIQYYSERDQVSLAYLNYSYNLIYDLPDNLSTSEYFRVVYHGGPLPVDPVRRKLLFPEYSRRREQWNIEHAKQSLPEQEDVEPPV